MKKVFILLIITFALSYAVKAQTKPAGKTDSAKVISKGPTQEFGKIDTSDLKMTSCDFEKDANAMVLFDKGTVYYKFSTVVMERHKRIKIFNDNGKDEANIRLEYYGTHHDEEILEVEAETINLNGKLIEYTAIDKKSIYTEVIDKEKKAIIFTFPNVKAGSVIEFKYKLTTPYSYNYPDWYFQSTIPTRYSEFDASFIEDYEFNFFKKVFQPSTIDTTMKRTSPKGIRHIWALSNIKAYKEEPFMDYPEDYLECVLLKIFHQDRTWITIGKFMLQADDFGKQAIETLDKENEIIAKANELKTDDEKIAFLFNTVKTRMKWNKIDRCYTIDGVKKAWVKGTGNSTEINLILYHLLNAANVNTRFMLLSTREYGKLDIEYPSVTQLNKAVVYCPVDTLKYYVLDASNQYNSYNETPFDLIGINALSFDSDGKNFRFVPLKVILINGSISNEGKLEGNLQISSSSYSREKYVKRYNDLGEKKYIDQMQDENKGLKITSLKMENLQVDTLPLSQSFDFKFNLTEPDDAYMYFNPNQMTGFHDNPFLSDTRVSNIDFGCLYSYSINGRYKIPSGYKVDVIPKSAGMQMPDKGITFKRFVAEDEGDIVIHYTIDYKRSVFSKDEYPGIRDFYKKMYEMLNEQIVLKKL